MTGIYTAPDCLEHHAPRHPESPDRLRAALAGVQGDTTVPYRWREVTPADPADLVRVHPESHVRRIAELARSGGGWVDPDTFVVPPSFGAACVAAGAMLQAVADVLQGHEPNGFVLVRPPGHHATADRSMGFCLFNTVAIAAEWAVREGGVQRVAILDVDVHHGNGTEAIFYDRPDILYYSTHQYPFYPGTGRIQDVGVDDGSGTTVNVPLMAGCGDATYLAVTDRILVPAVQRFGPELILVSLGFDAHWADPLAQMRLTTAGYAAILSRIRALADQLCGGRLVFLLEGGYDLRVLGEASAMAGRVLARADLPTTKLGPAPPAAEPPAATALIEAVCARHDLPVGVSE